MLASSVAIQAVVCERIVTLLDDIHGIGCCRGVWATSNHPAARSIQSFRQYASAGFHTFDQIVQTGLGCARRALRI